MLPQVSLLVSVTGHGNHSVYFMTSINFFFFFFYKYIEPEFTAKYLSKVFYLQITLFMLLCFHVKSPCNPSDAQFPEWFSNIEELLAALNYGAERSKADTSSAFLSTLLSMIYKRKRLNFVMEGEVNKKRTFVSQMHLKEHQAPHFVFTGTFQSYWPSSNCTESQTNFATCTKAPCTGVVSN